MYFSEIPTNADDCRLSRCADIMTGGEGPLPRCKPFKYCYEKEIVMYAYFKKLDYFSTECTYSLFAARGCALRSPRVVQNSHWPACLRPLLPHRNVFDPTILSGALPTCR